MFRFVLCIFGLNIMFTVIRKPDVDTVGLSSLCHDGKHVVFIDYDNIYLSQVLNEIKQLQLKWDIGTVAVLSSSSKIDPFGKEYGNWHVFGFAKMHYHEIIKMLNDTCCDPSYIEIPKMSKGRYWVLRVYPKRVKNMILKDMPVIRRLCYSKTKRQLSRSHYDFLCNVYKMPTLPKRYLGSFDKSHNLKFISYHTYSMPKTAQFKNMVVERLRGGGG